MDSRWKIRYPKRQFRYSKILKVFNSDPARVGSSITCPAACQRLNLESRFPARSDHFRQAQDQLGWQFVVQSKRGTCNESSLAKRGKSCWTGCTVLAAPMEHCQVEDATHQYALPFSGGPAILSWIRKVVAFPSSGRSCLNKGW